MMTDYTPTTEEVRYAWEGCGNFACGSPASEFDRWLAAHDSEIRNVAELDALTAAELLMKQREAEIRADEREKAADRVNQFIGDHGQLFVPDFTGNAWDGIVAAARGGEQA